MPPERSKRGDVERASQSNRTVPSSSSNAAKSWSAVGEPGRVRAQASSVVAVDLQNGDPDVGGRLEPVAVVGFECSAWHPIDPDIAVSVWR